MYVIVIPLYDIINIYTVAGNSGIQLGPSVFTVDVFSVGSKFYKLFTKYVSEII